MRGVTKTWGLDMIPDTLSMLGYNAPDRGAIMLYLRDNDTTEGCDVFRSEEDRQKVEDMIPAVPYDDPEWYAFDALVGRVVPTDVLSLTY